MNRISPFAAPLVLGYDPRAERERVREAKRRGGLGRQAKMTPEERARIADRLRQCNQQWWRNATPEQKRLVHAAGGRASMALRSPEERSAISRRANAKITPETRSAASKQGWANMPPEMKAVCMAKLRANASKAGKARAAKQRERKQVEDENAKEGRQQN